MDRGQFTELANTYGFFRCDFLKKNGKPREAKKEKRGKPPNTSTCQGAPSHTCKFELTNKGRIKVYQVRFDGTRYRWVWRLPL